MDYVLLIVFYNTQIFIHLFILLFASYNKLGNNYFYFMECLIEPNYFLYLLIILIELFLFSNFNEKFKIYSIKIINKYKK